MFRGGNDAREPVLQMVAAAVSTPNLPGLENLHQRHHFIADSAYLSLVEPAVSR
jgi:hypothetical protein